MTRLLPVLLVTAACGGSSKPAPSAPAAAPAPAASEPAAESGPPKQMPGGPSAEECDKLIDHALDLIEKSNEVTPEEKADIKKQRSQGGVKTSAQWREAQTRCMSDMKQADVQCALAAANFEEMRKCGQPPPGPASPKP